MYLFHNQNQVHFLWSSSKAIVMGGINLFTIFFSVYVFCWYISCLLFPFVTFPPPRFWQDLHLQPFLVWKQDSHILEKYFLWVYILTNKFYGLYILTNLFSNLKILALALSLYLNNIFAVCTIESYENFCIFCIFFSIVHLNVLDHNYHTSRTMSSKRWSMASPFIMNPSLGSALGNPSLRHIDSVKSNSSL